MFIGFILLLFAGAAYFMSRNENHAYASTGNYLMAVGLAVYVTGRIFQWRGRRERKQQEGR
jgi:hypothetical protein